MVTTNKKVGGGGGQLLLLQVKAFYFTATKIEMRGKKSCFISFIVWNYQQFMCNYGNIHKVWKGKMDKSRKMNLQD